MSKTKMNSRLGAVLGNRCPKCYSGRIFTSKAYDLKRLTSMHAHCPVCNEDFAREPGFYFGAAYVSYALTVALWVAVLVALICFDWWGWMQFSFFEDVTLFLGIGISLLIILLPLLYRLSRSIWLHMFTKHS